MDLWYYPGQSLPGKIISKINPFKNIHWRKAGIVTALVTLLMCASLLAAFGEDEGTLGDSVIWIGFAKLFLVLRFPSHTLLWQLFSNNGPSVYFAGLFFNCFFYGILIERIIYLMERINSKN